MKYKIKVVGNGIMVRGILFSPNKYNGLYEVDEELGKYLLNTFPKEFVLIEKIKSTSKKDSPQSKRQQNKSTKNKQERRKTTDKKDD